MTTPTVLPDHPYSNRDQSRYPMIKAYASGSITPGTMTTTTGSTGTLTVAGASLGDFVIATINADNQACQLTAYVNDGNSVTWVISNNTAGTVVIGACTLYVTVLSKLQGIGVIGS